MLIPPSQSAPSALSYSSPVVLTRGVQAPTMSPTVTGSVTTYSISPALPGQGTGPIVAINVK